ncbi:hypothetical protein FWG86_01895 [Candidatus Saccharibacteria bacterium]|nr:hypothetical protein [Candidatus Saccharibacteria bacterium]
MRTLVKRVASAAAGAAAFAIITGVVVSGFRPISAEEVQVNTTVGVGFVQISDQACSVDGPQPAYDAQNNVLDIEVLAGSIASNCIGLAVTSSYEYGYTLTLEGPPNGELTMGGEVFSSWNSEIRDVWDLSGGGSSSLWGFAIPHGQMHGIANNFDAAYQVLGPSNKNYTAVYAGVPDTATPISITDTANTTAHNYDIFFAMAPKSLALTGTYSGIVTLTAAGNPVFPSDTMPAMQTITLSNCPTSRTVAFDARDGNTYWVGMFGSTCWMMTNLAYAGGGDDTYGDTLGLYDDYISDFLSPQYFVPADANPTSGTSIPSSNNFGGQQDPQYGYLYNFCAAMGHQENTWACWGSSAPPYVSNPDPDISVCPAGWRLPAPSEFDGIPATHGGNLGSFTYGWTAMYSGLWEGGDFSGQGVLGLYWSSEVLSGPPYAYSLYLTHSPTTWSSENAADRDSGLAVRCVAM